MTDRRVRQTHMSLCLALQLAHLGGCNAADQAGRLAPESEEHPSALLPSGSDETPVTTPDDEGLIGPAEVEKIASYHLAASLDEGTHEVLAHGSIRWKNASRLPAEELYFHLYLNAFASERSLFMRSPHRRSRTGQRLQHPGGIEVHRLSSRRYGDIDLWKGADPHSPLDPEDATDIRVPLPSPVLPGESLELDIEFTAHLPRIVERTGYARSFHMVAQWFPKLARLEEDGRWAHFAFHPHAEYYADFGNYEVELDVPRSYTVGATGQRIALEERGQRRVERYFAEGVHDFAWTAWDGFEVERRVLEGVAVSLLIPPHTGPARSATWRALTHALPHLNARYGTYPYRTLTVVYPPPFARGAEGMEYPTLITTGGSVQWPRFGVRLIEQVTVHELAHQWFQGLLASNEYEFPFLDEGLTSYAEWTALSDQFGSGSLLDLLGLRISLTAAGRAVAVQWGRDEPIAQPAPDFTSMQSLAAHVYSRTATSLTMLARVYGEAAMQKALRDYATRHRFSHPVPADLLESIGRHLGEDAKLALETILFHRGTIDFAITDVRSTRTTEAELATWAHRVVITRRGNLQLPVAIRLEFADSAPVEHVWDGTGFVWEMDVARDAPLRRVIVDPDRRVLLDENLLNNVRDIPPRRSRERTSEGAWYLTELLLHVLGS